MVTEIDEQALNKADMTDTDGMCFSSICVRTYHACEETLECVGHEPSRIPSTHKGVIYSRDVFL